MTDVYTLLAQLRGQDPIPNRAEVADAIEALVFVPGQWRCPKCNFTLQQAVMNAQTGEVRAQDKPGEPCPNCDSPLWRSTWKQDAEELANRAVEQAERAQAAEVQVETLATDLAAVREELVDAMADRMDTEFYDNDSRLAALCSTYAAGGIRAVQALYAKPEPTDAEPPLPQG